MSAYSNDSKKSYDSWDDLVAAEANGVVVTVINTDEKGRRWTVSFGPYADKKEAVNAKSRIKTKFRQEQRENPRDIKQAYFIRPLWRA